MNSTPDQQQTRLAGAFWTGSEWVAISRVITVNGQHLTLANHTSVPRAAATGRLLAFTLDPDDAEFAVADAVADGYADAAADRPLNAAARAALRRRFRAGQLAPLPALPFEPERALSPGQRASAMRSELVIRAGRPAEGSR